MCHGRGLQNGSPGENFLLKCRALAKVRSTICPSLVSGIGDLVSTPDWLVLVVERHQAFHVIGSAEEALDMLFANWPTASGAAFVLAMEAYARTATGTPAWRFLMALLKDKRLGRDLEPLPFSGRRHLFRFPPTSKRDLEITRKVRPRPFAPPSPSVLPVAHSKIIRATRMTRFMISPSLWSVSMPLRRLNRRYLMISC